MKFLGTNRPFLTSIGSFQGLPAEVLEVFLLPQRLALTYSTTFNPFWQAFFQTFSAFFVLCIQGPVFHCKQGSFWLHFILSSYLYILYISTPLRFGASIYEVQTKLHICRRAGTDMEYCFSHSVFSSCFICRRVSQTASASMGSMPIRPMGMGPNTL